MKWNLKPGESKEAWLIRPYKNEESDVAALRKKDWADEFERGAIGPNYISEKP